MARKVSRRRFLAGIAAGAASAALAGCGIKPAPAPEPKPDYVITQRWARRLKPVSFSPFVQIDRESMLDLEAMVYAGEWDRDRVYRPGDVVINDNRFYIAKPDRRFELIPMP